MIHFGRSIPVELHFEVFVVKISFIWVTLFGLEIILGGVLFYLGVVVRHFSLENCRVVVEALHEDPHDEAGDTRVRVLKTRRLSQVDESSNARVLDITGSSSDSVDTYESILTNRDK